MKVLPLLSFAILLHFAQAQSSESNETYSSEEDGKIVGGQQVSIDRFPHQVSMVANNGVLCGGSLISQQWVLTAAHCVRGLRANQLRIRAGSNTYNSGGQTVGVSRITSHQKYNSRTSDYDVALLRLASRITVGRPIRVGNRRPANGQTMWVTGWGAQQSGGSSVQRLRGVQVRIVSQASCRSSYGVRRITNSMLCAGEPGKDSCQGDSGGPLSADGVLHGVVSWGAQCGVRNFPGVYADVANNEIRSFIRQTSGI